MAQIVLMLTVYLSIAVAIGSGIALVTSFLFVTTETKLMGESWKKSDVNEARALLWISIDSKGFPLVFVVEQHVGVTTKTEFIANNLMWDMAFHTFVTLGVMGMLAIESKKSKFREYDLPTLVT
jgi:hypothetical protein